MSRGGLCPAGEGTQGLAAPTSSILEGQAAFRVLPLGSPGGLVSAQHAPTLTPFKKKAVMDVCSLRDPPAEQTGLRKVRNPAGEAPTFVQPTQDKPQAEPSLGHPALFPGGPSSVTTVVCPHEYLSGHRLLRYLFLL